MDNGYQIVGSHSRVMLLNLAGSLVPDHIKDPVFGTVPDHACICKGAVHVKDKGSGWGGTHSRSQDSPVDNC